LVDQNEIPENRLPKIVSGSSYVVSAIYISAKSMRTGGDGFVMGERRIQSDTSLNDRRMMLIKTSKNINMQIADAPENV